MGLIDTVEAALSPATIVGRITTPLRLESAMADEQYQYVERYHYFVTPKAQFDQACPHYMNRFMHSLVPKLKRKERPKVEPFLYASMVGPSGKEELYLQLGRLIYKEQLGFVAVDPSGDRVEMTREVSQEFLRQEPCAPPYMSIYTREFIIRPFPAIDDIFLDLLHIPCSLIEKQTRDRSAFLEGA